MVGLKLNHVSKRGPRRQAIIGTNGGIVNWRINASLGLDVLMYKLIEAGVRVSKLSQRGLLSVWRQMFIWISAVSFLIGPLGINFNGTWNKIQLWYKETKLKASSERWRPFRLGPDVLSNSFLIPNACFNALCITLYYNLIKCWSKGLELLKPSDAYTHEYTMLLWVQIMPVRCKSDPIMTYF